MQSVENSWLREIDAGASTFIPGESAQRRQSTGGMDSSC